MGMARRAWRELGLLLLTLITMSLVLWATVHLLTPVDLRLDDAYLVSALLLLAFRIIRRNIRRRLEAPGDVHNHELLETHPWLSS